MIDRAEQTCPFCNPGDVVLESDLAYAKFDRYPAAPGHLLIITRRHIASFFETSEAERGALLQLLEAGKALVDRDYGPSGYNIGVNVGADAGQTIPHVHLHLIPRYRGDVPNPRGGVRGVIPGKQSY